MTDQNRSGTDDDGAVIERSRRDAASFTLIFDRHAPHIHRYLVRRVGRQVAEDLVAEAFLVAFAKRRRYDVRHRDARPWLYGIATNLVAEHRRREVRHRTLRGAAPSEQALLDHAERVVADTTAQSVRGVLREALDQLRDGDRDVVLLVVLEELTYDEVSRALGIPIGTVRSRMHRARTHLAAALNQTQQIDTYTEVLSNE